MEVKLPTRERILEVLVGEEFCKKLEDVASINSGGHEAGLLVSQSVYSNSICLSPVKCGSENHAPRLEIPTGNFHIVDLHSHPSTKITKIIYPGSGDIFPLIKGSNFHLQDIFSQKFVDYINGEAEDPGKKEIWISDNEKKDISKAAEKIKGRRNWLSYYAIAGNWDDFLGIVIYTDMPMRNVKKLRNIIPKKWKLWESQDEVIELLRECCGFADFLKYKKIRGVYRPFRAKHQIYIP